MGQRSQRCNWRWVSMTARARARAHPCPRPTRSSIRAPTERATTLSAQAARRRQVRNRAGGLARARA
eukprot:3067937-Pyramimonas_sp.AAC.1